MWTRKRTQTYLIQLRDDGLPGLCGRVQALGSSETFPFTSARELILLLRDFPAGPAPNPDSPASSTPTITSSTGKESTSGIN